MWKVGARSADFKVSSQLDKKHWTVLALYIKVVFGGLVLVLFYQETNKQKPQSLRIPMCKRITVVDLL